MAGGSTWVCEEDGLIASERERVAGPERLCRQIGSHTLQSPQELETQAALDAGARVDPELRGGTCWA